MDTHNITAVYNKGMSFTSHIDGHKVVTDSNSEGISDGPSPKRLMLASLAGCTGIDVVSILDKMKVKFSDFSIEVSAQLTEEHPRIYKNVQVIYKIKMDKADQVKMEKAVKLSEEKYCGVNAMFKSFTTVENTIVYL